MEIQETCISQKDNPIVSRPNKSSVSSSSVDPTEAANGTSKGGARSVEFPLTHYYELEGRVHTDQWSIPYKREESLAICMIASTNMMREGANVAEADENCVKFLTKTLPCSFDKLLTHEAVGKWDESIMKGIREMCNILLELISVRLTYKPVPVYLLDLLAIAFNANVAFHNRNRARSSNHQFWVSNLGEDGVFGQSPSFTTRKDPKGWLIEFMNFFAFNNGIARIRANILDKDVPPTLQELTALFNPFSGCDDYIVPSYFKAEMSECLLFAMNFIEDLKDNSLKDKEVGCVFDLLKTLKALFRRCGSNTSIAKVDGLRLKTTLRMFQIPHYNAKMNALKEVVRLTEEPYSAVRERVQNPIPSDKITEWLISNKVLSIAFGDNLHQAQYCDKVKSIVEFLGNSLSLDELSNIWEMQVDKNPAQVENIHNILAYAASRFNTQHMDHLFQLIQKSWEVASSNSYSYTRSYSYREKLLGLIGKIGKDDRLGKTAPKILEWLWNLAHLPQLSRETIELALNSHYSILIDSYHIRDHERRLYIGKCADDIKKCQWVVTTISHLHRLVEGMYNSRHGHKDQQQIADLQKQYDLLRVTAATLSIIHLRNVQQCQEKGEKLTGSYIMEGRYTHEECVDACLQFMSFLLRDGALYLPTKRANEIWEILIANDEACADDRRLAFKWFDNTMVDLEYDTQNYLFLKKVLTVDPVLLDVYGYRCVQTFFETINLNERKIRKLKHSMQLIVDNPDLTGLEYLWKAALEVPDKNIADELISSILQISYNGLNQKLKRDPAGLHRKFIEDCFTRLDSLCEPLEDCDQEKRITCIERLLLLAQRYITTVEELHSYPRQIPPHGACYHGNPITLSISIDQQQTSFKLECHTNETIVSVRRKIAKQLNVAPEQIQIRTTEKWLSLHHFNKLIHQMCFTENQLIIVKISSQGMHSNNFESIDSSDRLQAALKQEKILPGVLMSSQKDLYAKLESLCSSQEPRVILAVRNLLSLMPVNTKILEGLELFVHPGLGPGASEDSRPALDSKTVLEDFYSMKSISPTELLYNLEVLSGKLMPASFNPADTASQIFRKNFLEAGSLKYIIDIFQNSAFPPNTNLLIVQDCYVIALSLIQFLLCAQPTPDISNGSNGDSIEDALDTEDRPSLSRQMSKTRYVGKDEVPRLTIETMSTDDFTVMLTYLIEVCWATAAGRLDLITAQDTQGTLSAGICSQSDNLSHKDISISCECFELLVTCLKLRKEDLPILYKLPKIEEFLIDVLTGSASSFTRMAMVDYFRELCEDNNICSVTVEDGAHGSSPGSSVTQIPHYYFLHLLLSNTTPLWKTKSTDSRDYVSWCRSSGYFEFLVLLLQDLPEFEQKVLDVSIVKMINDEIRWLENMAFDDLTSHEVQVLLAGHLKLCTALFSCEDTCKRACSEKLVLRLLNEFLFPASILISEAPEVRQSGIINISAKCYSIPTRVAAYNLLVELSKNCVDNYQIIAEQLITMHHKQQPENPKEWEVKNETLKFMQNRDIYCRQYFEFIWRLICCNEYQLTAGYNVWDNSTYMYANISIELATKFLFHTYFRAYKDLRKPHRELWVNVMEKLLTFSQSACEWFIRYLSNTQGEHHLKSFLLECTSREVREDFTNILSKALHSYCSKKDIEGNGPVDRIISFLLQMLESEVIDNCKTCAQYFILLRNYANHTPGCHHLLSKEAFLKLTKFLLGTSTPTDSESAPRRWSSDQVKEFGGIYGALALLIRNTDLSIYESENFQGCLPKNPYMIPSVKTDLQPPSEGMHDVLFVINNGNSRFIKECSLTLRDSDLITTDSISFIFCYCCWNNQTFSASIIGDLQSQFHSAPASKLESYFRVLLDILRIEDSLEEKRIMFTFKGGKYDPEKAIFRTIGESNESKRIYQGIKFLVGLANKSKVGRSYILSQSDQLQYAVIWLKKKINEYSWSSSSISFSKESLSSNDTLEEANALLHELEAHESNKDVQSTSRSSSSNLQSNGHTNDLENANAHLHYHDSQYMNQESQSLGDHCTRQAVHHQDPIKRLQSFTDYDNDPSLSNRRLSTHSRRGNSSPSLPSSHEVNEHQHIPHSPVPPQDQPLRLQSENPHHDVISSRYPSVPSENSVDEDNKQKLHSKSEDQLQVNLIKLINEARENVQREELRCEALITEIRALKEDKMTLVSSFDDLSTIAKGIELSYKKKLVELEQTNEEIVKTSERQVGENQSLRDRLAQESKEHRVTKTTLEEKLAQENEEHRVTKTMLEEKLAQESEEHRVTKTTLEEKLAQENEEHRVTKTTLEELQRDSQQRNNDHKKMVDELEEKIIQFEQNWRIGNDEIKVTNERLGRGAWGGVAVGMYREDKVAVKQLHDLIVDKSTLAVMNREINTMSRLRHPNLLLFIGAVLDHPSGNPLIITEIMDTSLRQAYEKGQLTEETSKLSILRDTASGLNYLHCHHDEIIHRDVSSSNVLLESRGTNKWRAKLSDFGSANITRNAFTQAPGAQVYSAPEALVAITSINPKPQTTKIDVYSYGILACEVMCCQFPDSPAVFRTMLAKVHINSPSIGQMVQECINESPDNRPTMRLIIIQLDK